MAIEVIAHVYSSKLNLNGHTYHFALFYNAKKGRDTFVMVDGLGSDGHARVLACQLAGDDWEKTLVFDSVLPIKQWQREHKLLAQQIASTSQPFTFCGSKGNQQALRALFDITEDH